MSDLYDTLTGVAQWLSAAVLALVGVLYRSFNTRIAALEKHNGDETKRNDEAHQRIYDKLDALRLENKQDHREARLDIVQRIDGLSQQMKDRDTLASKLIESLRSSK